MGANTAFFSLLYGVVLRQPYPGAERLLTIHNVWAGEVGNGGRLSRAEFRDFEQRQHAFDAIAASSLGRMIDMYLRSSRALRCFGVGR